MKQTYQVKITLPNGQDRLLSMNEKTQGMAILAAKLHLYQILTDGGYFSGEEAAQEIEHYAFAIATPDEEHGLVFKREEVVVCQPQ